MLTDTLADEIDIHSRKHRCQDFDEDGEDVACKLSCWLYDPEKGICPYLNGDL